MTTIVQKINNIKKEEFVKCAKCKRKIGMNRNKNKIIVANDKNKKAIVYCSKICWSHRKDK